jgi:uncharacterized protein Yka (UPF0111/DUF47 family)
MSFIQLIKKYILPEEIDFFKELQEQSEATQKATHDLYRCFATGDQQSCEAILNNENQATVLKNRNMDDLSRAFITPVDREAIFRAITHLDWVLISIKHLVMESTAYGISDLKEYKKIMRQLRDCADILAQGFAALHHNEMEIIRHKADEARTMAHLVTESYVQAMSRVAEGNDIHLMFKHKELLSQIKSIAKRFHVTANTLQDISMKLG